MKAKLKDVVCIITDKKSSSLIDVNNYVSTENILPNREGIRFPAKSLPRISKILSYQKNDVLVSNIRPYFKKIWFSDRDGVRSNDVLAFRTKNSNILLQKYLYLLLQSDKFFDYVTLTAKGTKMPRGDKKAILNFTFELPSISTQKKLTNYFFVIESLIKLNNLINDNLLDIAKNIYHRILFSSQITKTNLRSFATVVMGQSPSSKTYNENKIGIPLLNGAADFRNGIQPSKWTTDPKIIVNKGAYIFGVRATIGLTAKVSKPYAIGRGTGSAIPKDVNNEEILYFILNDMFKKFEQTESGSVYINISKNDFENYRFNIPDRNGLLFFHEKVKPIMDQIYINKKQNKILQTIKATLLSKIF
ncbi:hypothetical protein JF73_05000 [Lactobacillus helsingborgensis]|uniref:Restriction endonuclease subunit S n=1 Tax=Lactobacillus helsingborgensis TaxID=1218494 RepID=A0AA47B4R1_9LACO|nr:restriction endonuclease subunit S [Lactobacillus helsingborgensis]KJY65408.1 hypothetical protein JF73_05000 [Lactobacillus helsingborgensis]MBC6356413.1 hypothetical protein [Lactobacillus helsingborgensis]UZX30133.1 restriction endonuclease subunit S [Lactobacillus helsingborgensis]